jgi:uncharacterized membrane protein YbhN (UPF0104 family)
MSAASPLRGAAKTALRVAVSVAILAILFARLGARDVLDVCLQARLAPLLLAFAVAMASQLVSAWRWRLLAHGIGFRTGWGRCVRIYLIGMFFGLAVPSTLGSDAVRALLLGAEPPGRTRALSSVLFDRLVGLVTLVAVAVAALLFGPSAGLPPLLTVAIVGLGAALVLGWLAAPLLARLLPQGSRLRRLVAHDLAPYFGRRSRGMLVAAVALSLAVHLLQIGSQAILARSLGLDLALGFVAIYHPLAALAVAVPLTIGGFGLREATYAYLLPYAGVRPDDAVALGLLWWVLGAAGGLVGGVAYVLSPRERALARVKRPAAPDAA